jgi:hypothetical protein
MARSNTCYLTLLVIVLFLALSCKCGSEPAAAGDREMLLAVKDEWGNPPQLAS